jgi:hypothetical protein
VQDIMRLCYLELNAILSLYTAGKLGALTIHAVEQVVELGAAHGQHLREQSRKEQQVGQVCKLMNEVKVSCGGSLG